MQKFNDNFDRISLDLADRSGQFSSEGTVPGGVTISAGAGQSIEVNVNDVRNIYQEGQLPIIPRFDIFLDNDLNGDYYWPAGGLITSAQKAQIIISVFNGKSIFNKGPDEKATYHITIANNTASSHTFYIYVQSYYVPAPDLGIATRDQ